MKYVRPTCGAIFLAVALVSIVQTTHGRFSSSPGLAPYTLRVTFDGGYVFDFGQQESVDVFALKDAGLPLKAVVAGRTRIAELDIHDAILTFEPGGTPVTESKPGIPPKGEKPVTCDESIDKRNVNNWYFIPSLPEIAGRMGTSVRRSPERYGTIRLSGGGAVAVTELGGCVEYRDAGSGRVEQRSIASGRNGIQYEWAGIPGTSLTLRLRSTNGGADQAFDVEPDARGEIVVHVTSLLTPQSEGEHTHDLADFWKHFGPIFGSIDRSLSLAWARGYSRSPGIDCPPGSTGP